MQYCIATFCTYICTIWTILETTSFGAQNGTGRFLRQVWPVHLHLAETWHIEDHRACTAVHHKPTSGGVWRAGYWWAGRCMRCMGVLEVWAGNRSPWWSRWLRFWSLFHFCFLVLSEWLMDFIIWIAVPSHTYSVALIVHIVQYSSNCRAQMHNCLYCTLLPLVCHTI